MPLFKVSLPVTAMCSRLVCAADEESAKKLAYVAQVDPDELYNTKPHLDLRAEMVMPSMLVPSARAWGLDSVSCSELPSSLLEVLCAKRKLSYHEAGHRNITGLDARGNECEFEPSRSELEAAIRFLDS